MMNNKLKRKFGWVAYRNREKIAKGKSFTRFDAEQECKNIAYTQFRSNIFTYIFELKGLT